VFCARVSDTGVRRLGAWKLQIDSCAPGEALDLVAQRSFTQVDCPVMGLPEHGGCSPWRSGCKQSFCLPPASVDRLIGPRERIPRHRESRPCLGSERPSNLANSASQPAPSALVPGRLGPSWASDSRARSSNRSPVAWMSAATKGPTRRSWARSPASAAARRPVRHQRTMSACSSQSARCCRGFIHRR
jgi:hypothetical protein